MQKLYHMLDITIFLSIAYHSQTNGQTEQINQKLEQYLKLFVSKRQDNWAKLLFIVESQYNNHISSAIQTTPFLLDSGCTLRIGFKPHIFSQIKIVNKFMEHMKSATEKAHSTIKKSKNSMAWYYNHCWTLALEFKSRNKVFLDASNIQTNCLS